MQASDMHTRCLMWASLTCEGAKDWTGMGLACNKGTGHDLGLIGLEEGVFG